MSRKLPISNVARRSLAWSLVTLGVIHLGLSALVGWGPAEFHDPLYGEKLQQLHHRIARSPEGTPLVVVLGSSRAMTGVNAQLLQQHLTETQGRPVVVYNFAVPGGGPATELLLLRRLLDDGVVPHTLLVEMWPCFFAEQAVAHNLIWLESHGVGLKERDWLAAYGPLADPRSVTSTTGLLVPWYRHRFALLRRFARGLMPNIAWGVMSGRFDEAGWEPIGGPHPSDEQYAHYVSAEKPSVSAYLQAKPPAAGTCRILQEVLALSQRSGIRVVLTMLPDASELRAWCPDGYRRSVMATLETMCLKYEHELVDGHDWLPDDDFFDPVHVISTGADHFTARLAVEMTHLDGEPPHNLAARPIVRR